MSMHLESPALTTTSIRKRKEKVTKAGQEELQRNWRDRNERLKEMGLPKETFEQFLEWLYGKGKKEKAKGKTLQYTPPPSNMVQERMGSHVSSTHSPTACAKKTSPVYTGTKVVGIAVMHKSCLQPVFSQEEAEQSAKMRR